MVLQVLADTWQGRFQWNVVGRQFGGITYAG